MKKEEEYAKARVKDIKKAHEDGCDDVKRVLENMYPEICEKKTNITEDVELRWTGGPRTFYVKLFYNGDEIGYIDQDGLVISYTGYSKEMNGSDNFTIFKL